MKSFTKGVVWTLSSICLLVLILAAIGVVTYSGYNEASLTYTKGDKETSIKLEKKDIEKSSDVSNEQYSLKENLFTLQNNTSDFIDVQKVNISNDLKIFNNNFNKIKSKLINGKNEYSSNLGNYENFKNIFVYLKNNETFFLEKKDTSKYSSIRTKFFEIIYFTVIKDKSFEYTLKKYEIFPDFKELSFSDSYSRLTKNIYINIPEKLTNMKILAILLLFILKALME